MKYLAILLTLAAGTAMAQSTNAPATPGFLVKTFDVEGNTVLRPAQIDGILTNYTGPSITVAQLKQGLGELQLLYRQLGFVTVSVTLPQQRLTNGVVRVKVIEGKVARISVTGERYFSSNNVMRSLPGLTTNVLLNTRWFQPELDRANNNLDRQIYPSVSPGAAPGLTDVTLKVKDRLPLHAHLEINNKATPGTPPLRFDAAGQYNNLWQLDHQVGLEYNFSPQTMKSFGTEPVFFDQPSVASYSGFYRIPFGAGENLRQSYDQYPVDFGYDQVTHQFRLPPPTGNPELVMYASRSASEIATHIGPLKTIVGPPESTSEIVQSQSAERDLSYSVNVGLKYTLPLHVFEGIQSSVTFGLDFKNYEAEAFSTNLFRTASISTDPFGNPIVGPFVTRALGTNSDRTVNYFPLSLGWSAQRPDQSGTTAFNVNGSLFLGALGWSHTNFQAMAGSQKAGGNYTVTTAGLSREQKLPHDWSVGARADGQVATSPLISNEQFALGGTGGVRGYEEGETYSDLGWRVGVDLKAPAVQLGAFPFFGEQIPAYVRGSVFMDYGEGFLIGRPEGTPAHAEEWGAGLSTYYTAGQRFDARLTVAWALHDGAITTAGGVAAYFSMGVQF
jgi:hemolysin activation/secretion protein